MMTYAETPQWFIDLLNGLLVGLAARLIDVLIGELEPKALQRLIIWFIILTIMRMLAAAI